MYELKKAWKTQAGYPARVLFVNDSHHCGYVGVTKDHPLYGKEYSTMLNVLVPDDEPIGKRGVMPIFIQALEGGEGTRMDCLFDVHGGITYSRKGADKVMQDHYWWIGFDCAHSGDSTKWVNHPGDVFRDVDYVMRECESLAIQFNTRIKK